MLFEPSITDNIILASKRAGAKDIPQGFTPVLIDRTSFLGNPFTNEHHRSVSIRKHREWFNGLEHNHRIKKYLRKLGRKIKRGDKIALICWCHPKTCHGQVYETYIKHYVK